MYVCSFTLEKFINSTYMVGIILLHKEKGVVVVHKWEWVLGIAQVRNILMAFLFWSNYGLLILGQWNTDTEAVEDNGV